jgi:hypothetical protein
MSRLRELNDTIIRVTGTHEANKLVKTWLPHQAKGIDKPDLGTGGRRHEPIFQFHGREI